MLNIQFKLYLQMNAVKYNSFDLNSSYLKFTYSFLGINLLNQTIIL